MNTKETTIKIVDEFYDTFYPQFLTSSEDIKRENKIRIFRKLPLLPLSWSIAWSWFVYAVIYIFFKPIQIIDKIFFLKTEFFDNNSSGTSIFLKTIWSSLFVFVIYQFALKKDPKLDVKDFAVAVGIISALYWNARNVFSSKWDYSADLYNKLSFEVPFNEYKDIKSKRVCYHFHQVTFAVDLLLLETWSHSSFIWTFKDALELAIAYDCFKSKRINGSVNNHTETLSEIKMRIENLYNGKAVVYEKMTDVFSKMQFDLTEYCTNVNFKKE